MKKISFKNDDTSRCLLTDMLPYELPLTFSNDGFFLTFNSYMNGAVPDGLNDFFEKHITDKKFKIPFNYRVQKSSSAPLTLSIMHPASQVAFINFYKDYDSLIVSLCQRSPFSIRYPASPQVSTVRTTDTEKEIPLRGADIDLEAEDFRPESMYPRNYFAYKKYSLLYKFYDSYEYQRLEKRFQHFMKFDIAKCFYHIYTHTISWAVKNKPFAKANKDPVTFEGRFDKLMQLSNYNETNGILVGPEVSRIFAEIILQKIDCIVEDALRPSLLSGRDYAVRRYVDDHFVFANDRNTLEKIKHTYCEAMEAYRLYINDDKTETGPTPATTEITVAKLRVSEAVNDLFRSLGEVDDDNYHPRAINGGSRISRHFIQKLKASAHEARANFPALSGLALSSIQKRAQRIGIKLKIRYSRSDQENLSTIFSIIIEIMSYITAIDMRVRSTLVFAQTCLVLRNYAKNFDLDVYDTVRTKITEELSLLLQKQSHVSWFGVERINLLLALKDVNSAIFYTDATCRKMLDKALTLPESDDVDYFQLMAILFCAENRAEFSDHRSAIIQYVENIFSAENAPLERAEYILMLLDMLSCPYLDTPSKERLFVAATKGEFTDPAFHAKELGDLKWFTNWHEPSIERMLERKALRPAYES